MPGATLVRTEAWKAAGPLDPRLIRGQDMDLFLALARMGPIETVPLPVFRYRTHDGLRGSAAGQWRKQDRAVHDARFRACVAPVFARRFAEASPVRDRAEAHAWALGLWQRGLPDEARAELGRWPAPYAPAEAWARRTIGLAAVEVVGDTTLVVVDEGDEGALEATLAVRAREHALFVDLHVPRDPLGNTQLYWPGTYVARGRLSDVVRRPGPWHLALTSAPGWVPPPLDDTDLLPSELPSPEAVLCTVAVLGWTPPHRVRIGLPTIDGVHSRLAWQARAALDNGQPARAMEPLSELLARLPGWRGAWRMSAVEGWRPGTRGRRRASRRVGGRSGRLAVWERLMLLVLRSRTPTSRASTGSSHRPAACATRSSPGHRRPLMALNHPPSRRCRRRHRPRRRRQRRRSRRRCHRHIAWIGPRC